MNLGNLRFSFFPSVRTTSTGRPTVPASGCSTTKPVRLVGSQKVDGCLLKDLCMLPARSLALHTGERQELQPVSTPHRLWQTAEIKANARGRRYNRNPCRHEGPYSANRPRGTHGGSRGGSPGRGTYRCGEASGARLSDRWTRARARRGRCKLPRSVTANGNAGHP